MGWEELEEELACPVCFEILNDPKTLPCLHSFCKECLEDISRCAAAQLECPTCRRAFDLPPGGVSALPSNFHLVNLIDKFHQMKTSSAPASPVIAQSVPISSSQDEKSPAWNARSSISLVKEERKLPADWYQRVTHPVHVSGHKFSTAGKDGAFGSSGSRGVSGDNGVRGNNGDNGGNVMFLSSPDGSPGDPGRPGSSGTHGTSGIGGSHGTDGLDISVLLEGSASQLTVYYNNTASRIHLRNGERIQIESSGGHGGDGGDGGAGGNGGDGGKGGTGGVGKPGTRWVAPGNGGTGGDGANGGDGGDGGDGGSGGNGGHGGHIIIYSADASLFWLIEAHHDGGRAGRAGLGGAKGAGGHAGGAGVGGNPGQSVTSQGSQAARGKSGTSGRAGFSGRSGQSGRNGKEGLSGKPGSVTYVLYDPRTGDILQRSSILFKPMIESFSVRPEIDDGVIEPNERILVSGIRIRNAGGIILPSGARVQLRCRENFTDVGELSSYVLTQSIERDQATTLPVTLTGAVGSLVAPSSFEVQLVLLERPFPGAQTHALGLAQYPVFLRPLSRVTGAVGKVELVFEIENRSNLPYGSASPNGSVVVSLETGDGVVVLSHEPQVQLIPPHGAIQVKSTVEILPSVKFYSDVMYSVFLSLRGNEVQKDNQWLRCVPTFDFANPQSDVLVLVASSLQESFFRSLEVVTSLLQLKYQIWDAELYGALCTHGADQQPAPWIGNYDGQLIIFVASSQEELALLPPSILYRHFYAHGPSERGFSSLLLLQNGAPSPRQFMDHLFRDPTLFTSHAVDRETFADWFSVSRVSLVHMKNKCTEIEKNYHAQNRDQLCQVHLDQYQPTCLRRGRSLIWKLWTYGNAEMRVSAFHRSCYLLVSSVKEAETPEKFLKAVMESLPYEYQIPLFHPSVYEGLRSLIPQPLEWIRSMVHSRLTKLLSYYPRSVVEYDLRHMEGLLKASVTSQESVSTSEDPLTGLDVTLVVEMLTVLYRLNSDLHPSWISTHKKKKMKRLRPLQGLISELENLLPRLNPDLLQQKAAEPLMICHHSAENLWRAATK